MISLIFPHKQSPENDAVLALKKQMLRDNTRCDYQLLYVSGTEPADVWPAWNWLAERAKYSIILWDNSDIVYAPNWDVAVRQHIEDADWLCLRLVECGAIGVAGSNIEHNFGQTTNAFDRAGFEAFAVEHGRNKPSIENGRFGWYSPSAFRRDWFLGKGGFPTDPPFPQLPNDIFFRERMEREGCRFATVNSYAYHFQRARENIGAKTEREEPAATIHPWW